MTTKLGTELIYVKKLNKLKNDISKRLSELETAHANLLAETINSTDDTRRMFEATRVISSTKDTLPISVFLPDTEELALNDDDKAKIVKNWLMEHYTGPEPPLEPFVGAAQPLNTPITAYEVERAAKKLKNGKAVGPDNLPNDLMNF